MELGLRIHQNGEVIGVVPAAGRGTRLSPLPCSKELFPIGFHSGQEQQDLRPKVAMHYLLDRYANAGITKSFIILRDGKWDIPAYFLDGDLIGMHLAYVVITTSLGPPDTVDKAYPFLRNHMVAFGFPDIIFGPVDVFTQLLRRHTETNADIVLGLYPVSECGSMDMVDLDAEGRARAMHLKPQHTDLRYGWLCAVWGPAFTEFMHNFVTSPEMRNSPGSFFGTEKIDAQGDIPVGAVIRAAIRQGLRAYAIPFANEGYVDIGTPGDLVKAVQMFGSSRGEQHDNSPKA